jgi:hypothetical protein
MSWTTYRKLIFCELVALDERSPKFLKSSPSPFFTGVIMEKRGIYDILK